MVTTEKKAKSLGLGSVGLHLGNLSDFPKLIGQESQFDLITFTNTIHELAPLALPMVIVESLVRLTPHGELFLYDMEFLPDERLELGALPWRIAEIQEIVNAIFSYLEVPQYRPTAGQWGHATCTGWNLQIMRHYMEVTNEQVQANREKAISDAQKLVTTVMRRKYQDCVNALESLTKYGPENPNEDKDRERLLHDLWALTRAVEGMK